MVCVGLWAAANPVRADPHPLPYSYPYSTLPRGMSEIEQYVDITPVRSFDSMGNPTTPMRGVLVTELEYGITDRLELGFYLQFSSDPGSTNGGDAPLRFDGLKQRLRYRFADAGVWPVNVAIYGEIAELQNEIELEAKIILDRRLGRWHLIANLWGEREFYHSGRREWVANPTGGASFEIVPAFHVGIEYWMRAEFGATEAPGIAKPFNARAHHYLGPAFLLQGGRVWLAVAPYLRLDAWDRAGQFSDQFGRFWVRTIVGIDL
ncbi:MAG: hypothetical protein ABUL77_01995 [Bacteroidota bacterium]